MTNTNISEMGINRDNALVQESMDVTYGDVMYQVDAFLSRMSPEEEDAVHEASRRAVSAAAQIVVEATRTNAGVATGMLMTSHALFLSALNLRHTIELQHEINKLENPEE